MKKLKITAPSAEFTGKRGNVSFIDGVGETDDPSMVAFFRRHGYGVGGEEPAQREPLADEPPPGPVDAQSEDKPAPAPKKAPAKKKPAKKAAKPASSK